MAESERTPPDAPYEVIARRYRPQSFREVVGQEAIAESLRQAILQNRLGHAYLFCGPRGVGKTSMARIFARALQCPDAVLGEPCGRCALCERISRGEDLDVTELDGASHRGIDDVRDLIERVRYAPTTGEYRIFIIDEVHMLTREAFNSLLKTLEEPPAHVKFVFATTEPEKIPPTVLSRCQRFDFSPISRADIVRRLEQICAAEGATPEEGLLDRIAGLARGGLRDSQSLLDQILGFAGDSPTLADLDRITGRLAPEQVETLIALVERGERAEVVRRLEEIGRGGTDPAVLLEQVIDAMRDRLHRGVAAGWGEAEIDRNLLAQEILQEARARVRRLGRADLVLELALLRLSTLVDLVPLSQWREALASSEAGPGSGAVRGETGAPPGSAPARADRRTAPLAGEPGAQEVARASESSARAASVPTPDPAPPAAGSGVAALRSAVATQARSASRAAAGSKTAAPKPAPPTAPAGPAGPSSPADPREAVRGAIERISPSLVRVVGEQYRIERHGGEWILSLGGAALGVLGERREMLRRELSQALGGAVRVELGDVGAPEPPAAGASPADEVPEIVAKAREIFRGELFGGGPPPRR